jgi:hypothetical protein
VAKNADEDGNCDCKDHEQPAASPGACFTIWSFNFSVVSIERPRQPPRCCRSNHCRGAFNWDGSYSAVFKRGIMDKAQLLSSDLGFLRRCFLRNF